MSVDFMFEFFHSLTLGCSAPGDATSLIGAALRTVGETAGRAAGVGAARLGVAVPLVCARGNATAGGGVICRVGRSGRGVDRNTLGNLM